MRVPARAIAFIFGWVMNRWLPETPVKSSLLICAAALIASSSAATVRYVNRANPTPASPYTSWTTAATGIQEAVDVSVAGDEVVVTNGIYASGGRAVYGTMTNRVVVNKA